MTTARHGSKLSLVIPLFNEEGNVRALCERIRQQIPGLGMEFELVLVDDGSKDGTWAAIEAECESDLPIVGLRLSRNFGHQSALLAGLSHARGDVVISMDGDLQHPPETIGELIANWERGYDVVNTKRLDTGVASPFKRLTSRLFYRFFSFMSGVRIAEGASDFRLLDRRVLEALLEMGDTDLFLRGAVEWLGFRSTVVEYQAGDRYAGTSKYRLAQMLRFALNAIVSYSNKPLWIGIWLGCVTSVLAFVELIFIMVQYLRGVTVPGWASTLGVMSFLFGVLFVILGIIGIYLSRIHTALQGRPRFIVAGRRSSPASRAARQNPITDLEARARRTLAAGGNETG